MKIDDRMVGLIGIVGSALLMHTIWNTHLQTKAFPLTCLFILFILSAVLALRKGHKRYTIQNLGKVLLTMLLLLAYILSLGQIGFLIATTLFLAAYLLVNKFEGKKLLLYGYSLLFPILIYLLFNVGFSVQLPEILF